MRCNRPRQNSTKLADTVLVSAGAQRFGPQREAKMKHGSPGFRGDDANAVDIGNNNIGTSFFRPTSHTYMYAPTSSMHALRGVSAAFACRGHSFTSETLTDSRGQSVVSHQIEVLLGVTSAPLAHREHAGTGRAKLLIFATFDLS
jgi:hypothetical protein